MLARLHKWIPLLCVLLFWQACNTDKTDAPVLDTEVEKEYEIEDLTLFCDPIDGTSNLIKGKYEIVSFLIGLTYKGKALLGYTHFFNYENSGRNLGFFNIPGFGIYELSFKTNGLLDNYTEVEFSVDKMIVEENKELKFIITSSRESPVMTKGKNLKYFSIRSFS